MRFLLVALLCALSYAQTATPTQWFCEIGQVKTASHSGTFSCNTSRECGEACDAHESCYAFDFAPFTPHWNNCRWVTYENHAGARMGSGGINNRQYCSPKTSETEPEHGKYCQWVGTAPICNSVEADCPDGYTYVTSAASQNDANENGCPNAGYPTCPDFGAACVSNPFATSVKVYCCTDKTLFPTFDPTMDPTIPEEPTSDPTMTPTSAPTTDPTMQPTMEPTMDPIDEAVDSEDLDEEPTMEPTMDPTIDEAVDQTNEPTFEPTMDPTVNPTIGQAVDSEKTLFPTFDPTMDPTMTPIDPTMTPTMEPTMVPTMDPTIDEAVDSESDNYCFTNGFRNSDGTHDWARSECAACDSTGHQCEICNPGFELKYVGGIWNSWYCTPMAKFRKIANVGEVDNCAAAGCAMITTREECDTALSSLDLPTVTEVWNGGRTPGCTYWSGGRSIFNTDLTDASHNLNDHLESICDCTFCDSTPVSQCNGCYCTGPREKSFGQTVEECAALAHENGHAYFTYQSRTNKCVVPRGKASVDDETNCVHNRKSSRNTDLRVYHSPICE